MPFPPSSDPGITDSHAHWEQIYRSRSSIQLSWHQEHAARSLELIAEVTRGQFASVIDIGGGDSVLVDALLKDPRYAVTVLDLAESALERSKARIGSLAGHVTWMTADVTRANLPARAYDVWHDRAVFHFLTRAEDRALYVAAMERAIRPGGTAIIATFAEDGPVKCSGLDVRRYSPEGLASAIGPAFELVQSLHDVHRTPAGATQSFTWAVFRLMPAS